MTVANTAIIHLPCIGTSSEYHAIIIAGANHSNPEAKGNVPEHQISISAIHSKFREGH
jgi:hypothetical protein